MTENFTEEEKTGTRTKPVQFEKAQEGSDGFLGMEGFLPKKKLKTK